MYRTPKRIRRLFALSLVCSVAACTDASTERTAAGPDDTDITSSTDVVVGDLGLIRLTAPAPGSVLIGAHEFVVLGKTEAVVRLEFWADGDQLIASSDAADLVPYDAGLLSNGEHTLIARAFGPDGSSVDSEPVAVVSHGASFKDGQAFHVAVDAVESGDGSEGNPWTIEVAMEHPDALSPGDTIWVHEGVYGWNRNNLVATSEHPIIVRAAPGEHANLLVGDGVSSNTWFWDFESSLTSLDRRMDEITYRPSGFYLLNPGHRVINCVVHDTGHPGIGAWEGMGDGAELYGNLMWGIGSYDWSNGVSEPWARGSAIYTQNIEGTRPIRDNILFRNFTNGIKPYGEQGSTDGYAIVGNTSFKNNNEQIVVQTTNNAIKRLLVSHNYTYATENTTRGTTSFGYGNQVIHNQDAVIEDNYFVGAGGATGALTVNQFERLSVKRNVIVAQPTGDVLSPRLFSFIPAATEVDVVWDDNAYFGGHPTDNLINYSTNDGTTIERAYLRELSSWQDLTGHDQNSSWDLEFPTDNVVFLRPNLYQRGRANLTIYNWEERATVALNIDAAGLAPGQAFEVRDVENYYGVGVVQGTFEPGMNVDVPMDLTDISTVLGEVTHVRDDYFVHSDVRFGSYVIMGL